MAPPGLLNTGMGEAKQDTQLLPHHEKPSRPKAGFSCKDSGSGRVSEK